MSERKPRIPSAATIIAWLGIIGTILGIVGFFISDLPGLFGNQQHGLTEEQIVQTLAALQADKERAELQLTQIALNEQSAANQQTQQAVDRVQAEIQATLGAVQTEQAVFLATRNAAVASTATAEAASLTATANAEAAAAALTATADFIAQNPTATPSPTPEPTATQPPAPAADHRSLASAAVARSGSALAFSVQTAQPIPAQPGEGLAYVWSLDVDRNPATGLSVQDIGVDVRVTATYENGTWVGRVTSIRADGTLGEPFLFLDISISADGLALIATVDAPTVGLPGAFDWVARAELGGQSYSFFPEQSHLSYP